MRYHVIGSQKQVRAMAVAGLKGDIVTDAAQACSVLERVIADKSVGTVLVSSLYYDDPSVSAVVSAHEKTGRLPVIMWLEQY